MRGGDILESDNIVTTHVIEFGKDQFLCIPEEMHTEKEEFSIRKIGDTFIAYPVDNPWEPTLRAIELLGDDHVADRMQPSWDDVPAREDM